MTSKSFRTDAMSVITPNMEKSMAKAFDEFAPKQAAPKQFNGTLRTYHNPNACKHSWKPCAGLSKEHAEYLKTITEETPEVGGNTKWCTNCGAVSYWENNELWLFDSTTRFFGKPPKRKHREQKA